jgi:NADH-quinone oxidoreductase subunit M
VSIARISGPELLVSGLVVAVLLGTGFYSEPWLELVETPLAQLATLFETAP